MRSNEGSWPSKTIITISTTNISSSTKIKETLKTEDFMRRTKSRRHPCYKKTGLSDRVSIYCLNTSLNNPATQARAAIMTRRYRNLLWHRRARTSWKPRVFAWASITWSARSKKLMNMNLWMTWLILRRWRGKSRCRMNSKKDKRWRKSGKIEGKRIRM